MVSPLVMYVILPVGVDSILCSRQSVLENPPQNQQRRPQAARPQPQVGARQPPNVFGFHQGGPQQQPENDALARVLGRFARNAAQPPQVAAGQHPQVQWPQNTGTQGWVPGPTPGVVIQYNIQYQGHPPHGQSQIPQSSQPVPPFTGFVGPNHDWHPWDFDQRWLNQRGAPGAREPSTSGIGNQPTSQAQSRDASQTPVEAAAQAALRRFGGHSATSTSSPSRSETVPSASSYNDTSTSWKVPSLIPLDSSQAAEILRAPSQHEVPNLHSSSPAAPSVQVPSSSLSFASSQATTNPQPCDQNSNHVTDAQLALLDRNTREAIDERIRILQGVSNTITRCMEDLVRARSVLPPSLSTASPQFPPDVTATSVAQCMFVVRCKDTFIAKLS
jgi:E3 ubiquitin-protein ligase synoviolin